MALIRVGYLFSLNCRSIEFEVPPALALELVSNTINAIVFRLDVTDVPETCWRARFYKRNVINTIRSFDAVVGEYRDCPEWTNRVGITADDYALEIGPALHQMIGVPVDDTWSYYGVSRFAIDRKSVV